MIDSAALVFVLQRFNPDIEAVDVDSVNGGLEITYLNKSGNIVSYTINDTVAFEEEADEFYLAVLEVNKQYANKEYLLLASLDVVLSRYKNAPQ